ncbi:MAG TPA: hypothetical protein VLX58_01360 [Bryobacteraceae bacterium]|nr:hypothetical protein [Bryobacteraceae bacterium]
MTRVWPLAILAVPLLVYSSRSDYASVQHKFDLIEQDRLKPGSRVTFTPRELNAYVEAELPKVAPEGVREPKLELGSGTATGSALIDFVKLRSAQGKPPGWLMRQVLEGERPVTVFARIQSANGRATVSVERVDISGITIEGRMLDYLIRNYLLPYYPDAKVDEPFEMSHRIDRLDIQPTRVDVILKK